MSIPVAAGGTVLGRVRIPDDPIGFVVFAHGAGSSRKSPRNRAVAAALERAGFATLLMDLLTVDEEDADLRGGRTRFDIDLLAGRLGRALQWAERDPKTAALPVGLFGASTGAAAALVAAASAGTRVRAVVSRGGRPDLAGHHLESIEVPTLLIVGERDEVVLDLNQEACVTLNGLCQLEVVAGATHLFEEPGALEQVARLSIDWFSRHLSAVTGSRHA